jgi:hypothetical protein
MNLTLKYGHIVMNHVMGTDMNLVIWLEIYELSNTS